MEDLGAHTLNTQLTPSASTSPRASASEKWLPKNSNSSLSTKETDLIIFYTATELARDYYGNYRLTKHHFHAQLAAG